MDRRGLRRNIIAERSVAYLSLCQDGLSRISRPQKQTVWPRVAVRSADQNHVLGALLLHHREAKEGGAGIQRVAQMQFDWLSTTPGRGTMVESSGGTFEYTSEKWLPPLPSYDGSPVFGK